MLAVRARAKTRSYCNIAATCSFEGLLLVFVSERENRFARSGADGHGEKLNAQSFFRASGLKLRVWSSGLRG